MWNGFLMMAIVFSMYFSGGMIPHYLVVKGVGLNNSIWALIIPSAISTYNLIIMRTAMVSVPDSLEESAKLDGANQWTILWKIMVPLVKPTIAVICLYYAVTHWNSWFNAMLFIRNKSGYPLQLVLREILLQNDTTAIIQDRERGEIWNPTGFSKWLVLKFVICISILLVEKSAFYSTSCHTFHVKSGSK